GRESPPGQGPYLETFRVLRSLLRPGKRVEQKPSLDWRHGTHPQACIVSAVLHVRVHSGNCRPPLRDVWPDLQHEIEIRACSTERRFLCRNCCNEEPRSLP